jgi:hypothetical protein
MSYTSKRTSHAIGKDGKSKTARAGVGRDNKAGHPGHEDLTLLNTQRRPDYNNTVVRLRNGSNSRADSIALVKVHSTCRQTLIFRFAVSLSFIGN